MLGEERNYYSGPKHLNQNSSTSVKKSPYNAKNLINRKKKTQNIHYKFKNRGRIKFTILC